MTLIAWRLFMCVHAAQPPHPPPTHLTHPIPSQHTYVCTCVSVETHSLLHPLCVQNDSELGHNAIISIHHYVAR